MSRWTNMSRRNNGSSRTRLASDFALFNLDDDRVAALRHRVRATRLGFTSRATIGADMHGGTYLEGDRIVTTVTGVRQEICHRSEIRIIGNHNVENVMAADNLCRAVRLSARCDSSRPCDVSRARTCP